MDWKFTDMTKDELIEYLTQSEFHDTCKIVTIRKRLRGRQLWTVKVVEEYNSGKKTSEIVLFVLKKLGSQWGFKMYQETLGIPYFTCPHSYLNLTNLTNAAWRREMKIQHELANFWEKEKVSDNSSILEMTGMNVMDFLVQCYKSKIDPATEIERVIKSLAEENHWDLTELAIQSQVKIAREEIQAAFDVITNAKEVEPNEMYIKAL